jgi:replicative DNA helicase
MEFTPQFQRELVVLLLQDPTVYNLYLDIWRPSYFDEVAHRNIVDAFLAIRTHGEHPTKTSVTQQLLNGTDRKKPMPMDKEAELEELEALYKAIPQNKNTGQKETKVTDYSLEIVRQFAKTQAVVSSLGAAIECVQSGEPEKALSLIATACQVGSPTEEELENVINDLAEGSD